MSIPMARNPALRPGLAALAEFLRDKDYSTHAIDRVLGHVGATGCLATAAYLDREDEAEATEVFIGALPEVPDDSQAWSKPDVFIDVESLIEALARRRIPRDAILLPPELEPEYEPTAEDLADFGHWLEGLDREQVAAMVAPISGGGPDDGDDWPRTKTAANRRHDMEDVRRWYAEHPECE
jgi:hypothetical protein